MRLCRRGAPTSFRLLIPISNFGGERGIRTLHVQYRLSLFCFLTSQKCWQPFRIPKQSPRLFALLVHFIHCGERGNFSRYTSSIPFGQITSQAHNLTQKLFESLPQANQFACFSPPFENNTLLGVIFLAEREGFEPSIRFRVYYLSKVARSTALPSLQNNNMNILLFILLPHFPQDSNSVSCWWMSREQCTYSLAYSFFTICAKWIRNKEMGSRV